MKERVDKAKYGILKHWEKVGQKKKIVLPMGGLGLNPITDLGNHGLGGGQKRKKKTVV